MHVKLCAAYSNGQECCISAMPGRRHSMRRYKPNPQEEKDEFTHEAFWESIGFKDPCSNEDKEIFGKCNHFCAHPSHSEDGEQKSFCTLPLWHDPLFGARVSRARLPNMEVAYPQMGTILLVHTRLVSLCTPFS